jgi:hypothetical protein
VIVLSVLLVALSSISCESADPAAPAVDPIQGTWVVRTSDGPQGPVYLDRVEALPSDRPGYIIDADGQLRVRKAIGWCGTPPIPYGVYDGVWDRESEKTILLRYAEPDRLVACRLEILSLDGQELRCRITEYERRADGDYGG